MTAPQRNPEAVCGTCPYFETSSLDDSAGRCRRHAPREAAAVGDTILMATDDAFIPANPWMSSREWCGEHPEFFLPGSGSRDDPEGALRAAVVGLVHAAPEGTRIPAIKYVRQFRGCHLKAAKDYVDAVMRGEVVDAP